MQRSGPTNNSSRNTAHRSKPPTFRELAAKSGIKKASSAAVAADPTDAKTAAVVYLVNATLQGRAVYKYPYHVFVYRRDDGFWFVAAGPKQEQGLVLGPPPKGFKPVEDAPATDVTIPFVALYLKSPEVTERVKAAEDLSNWKSMPRK